jgi:general secretion pathway protein G
MYAQDNDQKFALGGDPADLNTDTWEYSDGGQFWVESETMAPLPTVLSPYVKSPELWRCPSDVGFDFVDVSGAYLPAHPSSYDAFGSSYYYKTELAFRQISISQATAYEAGPPVIEHGPSDVIVLFDGSGMWHQTNVPRYNSLMADGHVKNLNQNDFSLYFSYSLIPPSE